MAMNTTKTEEFALDIRKQALSMVYGSKSSHIGGAFSMADMLAVLYEDILEIEPANPKKDDRDRFLLSKGHACSALYAALGLKGFFPIQELTSYAADGSRFVSHASHYIPGVEISAGSLGHALSVACGLSIAAKRKGKAWKTFCLLSDGELNEGSNWEVFLLAPQLKLDNLIVLIDYNKIQSLGFVKDVIDLEPLSEKFESFGWETFRIDGHNCKEIYDTLIKCKTGSNGIPKVVIADTIKGKGVDFMEGKLLWHYKSPNTEEYKAALEQLK
jgi:transketolase